MNTIGERWQAIMAQIAIAEADAGRAPGSVTLVAVSKAQAAESIRAAFVLGQQHFGENYLQEALQKQQELHALPITWHFIGPIQSNKTQAIATHFAWVHGVDRNKIADRLNAARPADAPVLQVCIQLNISDENSKSGVNAAEALSLAQHIATLPRLRLRGLMAIPAPTTDLQQQRAQFHAVRQVYEQLLQQGHALDTLSMGMSEDFPAAIAEGATIVRVGSAIFGARPSPIPAS